MTVTAQPYRVGEIASNQPNVASAYNLPGSALAHFRTFTSQLSNADVVRVLAYDPSTQGAVNGAWEVTDCTYTTGSPNTLVRTTLVASSTGSKIDWSSEAVNPRCVVLGALADEIQILHDNGTSGLTATTLKTALEELAATDALLLTDPLTTKGDIVIRDTSAAIRLAKGTEGQYLVMGGSDLPVWGDGLVINEAGADVDFRVESDTDTHALFVRGSDGRVIFGTPFGGTQYTHEVTINDATAGSNSITGGSGFFPQSTDTLSIGNADGTIANGYTSLHMLRGGSGGAAAAKVVLENLGAGNSRLSFMLRDSAHTTSIDTKMHIDNVGVVVNPLGTDRDFQVESDTDTHALFVRGSDGEVGVGASAPLGKLHVKTGASSGSVNPVADELVLESGSHAGLTISTPNTSTAYIAYGDSDSATAAWHVYNHSTDTYFFKINSNDLHSISTATTVVNDAGLDHDFRVESDTDTHALFVRGSDGKVGIGESAPLSNMHITSGSSGLGSVNASGDELILESAGNAGMTFMSPNSGYQYVMFADADNTIAASLRYAHPTDEFSFYINGVSYFDVAASEVVVNEASADVDFRVESAVDTHALFVQGSNGVVGIGESAPSDALHITRETGNTFIKLDNNHTDANPSTTGIRFMSHLSGTEYNAQISTDYLGGLIHNSAAYGQFFKLDGVEFLRIRGSGITVNETGLDQDFRVESAVNTHTFFLEGSSGHIGIGNSTPLSPLDIKIATGDSGSSSGLVIRTVDGGAWALYPASAVANPVWNTNVNSGESYTWSVGGANKMSLADGLQLGAPTGGDKGTGTLNAVSVYDDNTLLTDFVLDQAVDGEIDFEFYDSLELGGVAAHQWDPRNLDIDHYEEQWKERKALPSFRSREERFDDEGNEIRDSLGALVQGLQQELETAMVHIAQLNARLKQLEE